jgi:hypothetical protein
MNDDKKLMSVLYKILSRNEEKELFYPFYGNNIGKKSFRDVTIPGIIKIER